MMPVGNAAGMAAAAVGFGEVEGRGGPPGAPEEEHEDCTEKKKETEGGEDGPSPASGSSVHVLFHFLPSPMPTGAELYSGPPEMAQRQCTGERSPASEA